MLQEFFKRERTKMEATPKRLDLWCLVLLVISAFATLVDSQQPDSTGYINIDCGLTDPSYSDGVTKLTYVSDDQFIDTGLNVKIASKYAVKDLISQFLTVRSFPNGTRNCYTLRSLTAGSKYLVRAMFMYGDYDGLNKLPTFDIHLGVNPWNTIMVNLADGLYISEIITTATSNYLQVCLINKDLGTPFISGLELRPLPTRVYADANSTHSLVLYARMDFGGAYLYLRYPYDPYDRIWWTYTSQEWRTIAANFTVRPNTDFEVPSPVMQTAIISSSKSRPGLTIPWVSSDKSTIFLIILHICDLTTATAEYNILINEYQDRNLIFAPGSSLSKAYITSGYTEYNVSVEATSRSVIVPLLNALELYIIQPTNGIPSYSGDVSAIETIKNNYRVNKSWSGDPCVPTDFSWTGINCTSDSSKNPRITALNLSYSGLTGSIISAFGDLSALKSLDLSYNDLSGALPTSLDQLTALTYLDITGNTKISTTLPPSLQKKYRDGTLIFKFQYGTPNPSPHTDYTRSSTKKKFPVIIVAIAGAVVLLLIISAFVTVLCLMNRRRSNQLNNIPKPNGSYGLTPPANNNRENFASNPEAPLAHNYMGNYASSQETYLPNNHMGNYQNTPGVSNPQRNNM